MTTKRFCFVIASYNNELNIRKNLISVITQTNPNWRCIYINDCSTDNTELLFFDLIKEYNIKSKFTYIKNETRMYQMYSKYIAYKLVNDFEIVCLLDGDDWLSDNNVLDKLEQTYSDSDVKIVIH
jgi:glycosyltransferase involved in cell wall biosynthesis